MRNIQIQTFVPLSEMDVSSICSRRALRMRSRTSRLGSPRDNPVLNRTLWMAPVDMAMPRLPMLAAFSLPGRRSRKLWTTVPTTFLP